MLPKSVQVLIPGCIRLRNSNLCLDCDMIFDEQHPDCPACASSSKIDLLSVLQPMKHYKKEKADETDPQ